MFLIDLTNNIDDSDSITDESIVVLNGLIRVPRTSENRTLLDELGIPIQRNERIADGAQIRKAGDITADGTIEAVHIQLLEDKALIVSAHFSL